MTRVVVDTNVLVFALINEHGAEAAVLSLVVEGKLIWCVSEAVLKEYEVVLHRRKFQHINPAKIAAALTLAQAGAMTIITSAVTRSPHEPDNRFLECAEGAKARYLVTGNTRHFPKYWKSARIVNARELLQLLPNR